MTILKRQLPGMEALKNYFKKLIDDITLPIGTIIMFHGTKDKIPKGWVICDGTNGTPDLRDRYPVGTSSLDDTTGTRIEQGLPPIGTQETSTFTTHNPRIRGSATGIVSTPSNPTIGSYVRHGDYGDQPIFSNVYTLNLNAGGIYGNSTTVRPPSTTIHYIMRVS